MFAAKVLDHLVRLQHIAANLAAEPDISDLAADLSQLGVAFLALEVQKFGFQRLHRSVTVLMLASFVLTRGHCAGRQVGNPHRRVGLVDVLPTSA